MLKPVMRSFLLVSLSLSLLLLSSISLVSSSPFSSSPSTLITIDNPSWYWTEHNFFFGLNGRSLYAQTSNPGAYFKIGFTGTTAKLFLDWTGAANQSFATIRWTIDQSPFTDTQLPLTSSFQPVTNTSGILDLVGANTLAPGSHTLVMYVLNSLQSQERWTNPTCFVRVNGLYIDGGAQTFPMDLQPKRVLAYWDSIGEGVGIAGRGHGDLIDNDATNTWAFTVAFALSAEISVVAFGRQGFNITGNGGVPPLITPGGDPSLSAWDKYDAAHSRVDENGVLYNVQPDYILCGHGTNDALNNIPDADVIANLIAWLQSMRKAAPNAAILVAIPFGTYKTSAIALAFAEYQITAKDELAFLITTGVFGAMGVDQAGHPSAEAGDGLHPFAWRSAQLGGMLVNEIVRAVSGEGRSTVGEAELRQLMEVERTMEERRVREEEAGIIGIMSKQQIWNEVQM